MKNFDKVYEAAVPAEDLGDFSDDIKEYVSFHQQTFQ